MRRSVFLEIRITSSMTLAIRPSVILIAAFLIGCDGYSRDVRESEFGCQEESEFLYTIEDKNLGEIPEYDQEILVVVHSEFEFTRIVIFRGKGDQARFAASINGEDAVDGAFGQARFSRLLTNINAVAGRRFVEKPGIFHPVCFDVRVKNAN